MRYAKNLKQFYIGQFELRLDEADLSNLKNEVENRMLIRKDEATAKQFNDSTRLLKKHNVVFTHLMDTTGDSYLARLYLMRRTPPSSPRRLRARTPRSLLLTTA